MKIALVEDQIEDKEHLIDCIQKLFQEKGMFYELDTYDHVENFNFAKTYDLIFLDIVIHDKNGFELSKKIRESYPEDTTSLVFVTTLTQYAIEGYSVGAASYILKPYTYNDFVLKMIGLLKKLKSREESKITLYTTEKEYVPLDLSSIYFIESRGHYLTYHTKQGEYLTRNTITNCEESLKDKGFFRVSNWCIVSLRNIDNVAGDEIVIDGTRLSISRSKKKSFLEEFSKNYGI